MIYTVTLNPALDYVIQVDHFQPGRINRNRKENIFFGGKGINVSCILNELGVKSTALGFIAGFTGRSLRDGLKNMGITADFTEVKEGMTRINVKMKSDEETEINGMGPLITESDFAKMKEKIRTLRKQDILILSGSIPSCMDSDAYERIIECLQEPACLIVDAEKNLLLPILKYRPFLIKPNTIELEEISGKKLNTTEEIVLQARRLQAMGARNVLVSRAKEGAVLIEESGRVIFQDAAHGTVVNSVGAGDSMVAGFLAGWIQTGDSAYALKLGTACGGATAFHTGLAERNEIEEVLASLKEYEVQKKRG